MQQQDIIEHLRAGWDLSNRGTGWYLSSPRSSQCHQISDVLVNEMEFAGLIVKSMPYNTIHASLVEQQS